MPPKPLNWQIATVRAVKPETQRVKSFTLELPDWRPFRAGQHYDVRLTAPDGYQAQRSYSIASAPGQTGVVEITVEVIEDGEVSPYFHEVVQEGDQFEVRGPIGGPFTWGPRNGGPLLLIGGGSGVVPLMSMLRHRKETGRTDIPALLLYSARGMDDVIYRDELLKMADEDDNFQLTLTLTRRQPPDWTGNKRRIDAQMVREAISALGSPSIAYVCGSTGIVEAAAGFLVDAEMPTDRIRTERFGPSGV